LSGAKPASLFEAGPQGLARTMETHGEVIRRDLKRLHHDRRWLAFEIDALELFGIGRPAVRVSGKLSPDLFYQIHGGRSHSPGNSRPNAPPVFPLTPSHYTCISDSLCRSCCPVLRQRL